MRKPISALVPAALLSFVFALPGNAALVGTSVTGSLTFAGDPSNYFDPGYGFVPATGYLNISGGTVTISNSAVEFGFDDGFSRIAADFSGTQLVLTDLAEAGGPNNSFQMMFTDSAFAMQYLSPVSDSFPLTSYSVSGDVMTINYGGSTPLLGQVLSATFNVVPIPEPSTLGFVFASALAALGIAFSSNRGRKRVSK